MGRFDCKIVGIDLGTTNTVIAYYDGILKKGVCCSNSEGSTLTASAVTFFSQDNVIVGNAARDSAVVYPETTATLFKRKIGIQSEAITISGNSYSPQQLSALVLKSVVNDAEEEVEEKVADAVITVPAYFGTNRRKATMEAGRLAGLNVRGILDEPIAAMYHAASITNLEGKTCLVFDLGGGTLDIVVARVTKESIDELVIDGNLNLGGNDWDVEFVKYIKEKYLMGKQLDLEEEQELIIKAQMAKKRLSEKHETKFSLSTAEGRVEIILNREEFEKSTIHLMKQVCDVIRRVKKTMEKKNTMEADMIILAGGATRMPAVRKMIEEMFPGKKIFANDVDCAVANGAAIYAKMLQQEEKFKMKRLLQYPEVKKLKKVVGRSYGISAFIPGTDEEKVWNIIFRNSQLPACNEHIFNTRYENQKTVLFEIYENTEEVYKVDVVHASMIGKCVLQINGDLPAGAPVHVSLKLDTNGILHVRCYEESGNTEIETSIQTEALLEEGDIIAEQEQIANVLRVV